VRSGARAADSARNSSTRRIDSDVARVRHEPRETSATRSAQSVAASASHRLGRMLVLAALAFALALGVLLRRRGRRRTARIMSLPESEQSVGGAKVTKDSGRAGLAVCVREAASGPRGGLRGAGGHLCPLPPVEGRRRP